MPKDSNLEKRVLEGDSVEQKAMKKEEEKETKFLKEIGQKDYSKYSKEELWNLTDEEWNDWFAWSERKRYEARLAEPLTFREKLWNWRYEFKRKWIKNWFKEWWDSYRWRHGGKEKHFAPGGYYEKYSEYMRGVHECYERARKREAEEKRGVKENNRQV